jgi:hypothetical protein
VTALATLVQDDFSSGSLNGTRWPTTGTNTGGAVTVSGGQLRLEQNWDAVTGGWPPANTFVRSQAGEITSTRVYWRYDAMRTDDNGAGEAHKVNTLMGPVRPGTSNEGFGFRHEPSDAGVGRLFCEIWNNFQDEWRVDVGEISSYNPDGSHAWVGVRYDGTNFYWDTAPDSGSGTPGTWTNRFSYSKSGSGVSFDSMAAFTGTAGAAILFYTYHWADTFDADYVVHPPRFDGVNSALVASVTHAATGVLVGPGTTLAGSAARTTTHGSSGVLVGPGAALAGSAAILRVHEADGALAGPGAAIAGQALIGVPVEHVAEGALAPNVDQGAILTASATLTPDPDKTHSVQDAFDGASLDAGWDDIAIGAPGGSVTVSGGNLRIEQTSNVLGTGWLVRRTTTKDFQSSYVYTRLINGMIVSNNANGAEANFGVIDDTDSGYLWQQRSNGTLVPHWKVAGVANDGSAFAYTPATHAWLRILELLGTVYWQHAPSTASNPPQEHEWITDHTRTRAADGSFSIASMRVRFMTLMSFGTPGTPTGAVRFDCVNMRTTQVIVHDATGDVVGDLGSVAGTAAKQANHDAEGALVGPGSTLAGEASDRFEHTAVGALVGEVGSAIIGQGSTSDLTRLLWVNTQDTGGAWNESAQSDDPWTPRDDTGSDWAS